MTACVSFRTLVSCDCIRVLLARCSKSQAIILKFCVENRTGWNVSKKLANSVKRLRKKMNWSQLQLAIELGVEQSTVSRWERGITEPAGLYAKSLDRMLTGDA